MDTHSLQSPRIALLIDFDNVILGVEDPPGFDIELVVNALRSRGVVVLGRAYGDWYRHHRHRRKLMDHGIELVETPAFGPIIKNSADIRIALDGFEIGMTQHHITEICLVSGDSDFLPLIKRLQYLGKTVSVISGVKFTSELVRRNCNEFISYENLLADSVGATEDATTLEGAFTLLARTIHTLHERGMEVRSSTVKQMMIQLNPVFSERTFGCAQFKQFLDKGCRAGIIKLGRRDPNSGEYNVLLPGDLTDEPGDEAAADEAAPVEKAGRTPRRGRTRRTQSADEDLTLEPIAGDGQLSDEASETNAGDASVAGAKAPGAQLATRDAAERETSAREALRQGRLRSSGRTWKGKVKTRSILQGALGTLSAAPAPESSDGIEAETVSEILPTDEATPLIPGASAETTADAAAELVAFDGGVTVETDTAEVETAQTETTEAESAQLETAQAENVQTETPQPETTESETPQAEPAVEGVEAEAEATEKPKRATRRRRKPAAKKTEAAPTGDAAASSEQTPGSEQATEGAEAPVTPAVEVDGASASEAAGESELPSESVGDEKPTEEKKAAKKPVRRRTPRKKKEE